MNYFPFHLGDYAAHTTHLEPMEDLAFRRMLDLYYRTESALPQDVDNIARLVRLKAHREAIVIVLNEFFVLSEDGWHSKRADDELTAMKAKQEQQAAKDGHEVERMRRHRERRAEMFATLRAAGVVPAWDLPMKELQRLLDEAINAPATRTGALPDTDMSRLSLPTPTPTPIKEEKRIARGSRLPVDFSPDFDFAFELGIQNTLEEASKFRDYWRAQPGQKGVKTDWPATWRNWCRNAKPSSRSSPLSFRERDAANAAARIHEMTGGLVSAKPVSITRRNDALQEVFDAIPTAKRLG